MHAKRAAHLRRQASVDYPRYPPANSLTQQPPLQMPAVLPVSDYESDNQGYGSDILIKPPPPTRTVDELNISVLKRQYPETTRILSIIAYAVVYEFSPIPEPTWSKCGIEGSMFICQMSPGLYNEDRYTAVVLNRRGLNNFEAELREAEESGVEISDPYVIISCKEQHEQKIFGIFIFSDGTGTSAEQQRADNANVMKTLAVSAGMSRRAAEVAAANAVAQHHDGHVQEAVSSLNDAVVADNKARLLGLFGQPHQAEQQPSSQIPLPSHTGSYPGQHPAEPPHQDVLGDLFRRAGLK